MIEPWVWQQYIAPCHVSKKSLERLEEHCFDFVPMCDWPPSSPDVYPMDYFFYGYLEAKTSRAPHTTMDSLITAIMEQTTSLSKQVVAKAYKSFRSQIQVVIDNEGGWIE